MGANLAHQLDNMELIAGDGRIVKLSEVADLGDNTAKLVKSLNCLAHCFIGNINAQAVSERLDNLELKLCLVIIKIGLVALHGRIDLSYEETFGLNGIDEEEVFLHTLDGSTALCAEKAV